MSDLRTITARQAYGALREVVDTYGEGTVADFVYVEENEREGVWEPRCIVGHALVHLGIDPADLVRISERSLPIAHPKVAPILAMDAGVRLSRGAATVLRQAQAVQDTLDRWGDALVAAEAAYHNIKDRGEQDDETAFE